MSMTKGVHHKQSGDTIIEVMIVLAVLGLAIGISYRTAVRSLLAAREAQENTQATELLQGQTEKLYSLKTKDSTDPDNVFKSSEFCILTSHVTRIPPSSATACDNGIYTIRIVYCNLNAGNPSYPICALHAADDTFALTATWDNARGVGKDKVAITYRLSMP